MAHVWWHLWGADEEYVDMGFGYDPSDPGFYDKDEFYSTPDVQEIYPTSFQEYEPLGLREPKTYYEESSFLDSNYYEEEEQYQGQQMDEYTEEYGEKSYAELARGFIDQLAPWLGGAAKLQKFAKGMTTQRQRQGRGGGGDGRQMRSPYTTHSARTTGRTQADIQSTFRGRDSRQLMALLSQQSQRAASAVQIVANKAAQVGDPVKGNDLYDLISGETKPLGAKQQLPTGQSFRSLAIRRRSQMA